MERHARVEVEEYSWQRYATTFDWLNTNTPKDSVVYADDDITRLLAGYTHNNIFYGAAVLLHFMPSDEVIDRFVINNYFRKEFPTLPD